MSDILYIVVPCYNEEEVFPETAKRLTQKMQDLCNNGTISSDSRILFVDDGSKDKTWSLIEAESTVNAFAEGLKLSRNKGHQNALVAGLMEAKKHCDVAISMDADLQDDINAVDGMMAEYASGSEVVYGVRSSRKTDTAFKRSTAQGYYKAMRMMGVDIVYNHADYRLMSKRAIMSLADFKEVNLFLRGIVPLIGFKTSVVEYERGERFAGESKYPLKKMLAFAFDGITSFSVKPIRIISTMGVVICILSVLALIYSLIAKLFFVTDMGWTSLICSIWFIGGVQLLSIGVIGEYIGKIYMEVKARPKYFIEKNTLDK